MKKFLYLAILLVFSFVASACEKNKKRVHVVPDNYNGWILILENQEIGQEAIISDNVQVIVFSEDGLSKIKGQYLPGWGSDLFLTYGGETIPCHPDVKDDAYAIRSRKGGFIEKGDAKLVYQTMFIGKLDELNADQDGYESKLRTLISK